MTGMQRVEVFNSGLEVWLYDASHRAELKASEALEEDVDEEHFERAMKSFVRDGRIMAYQLMEDNSLNIDIAVREPLTRQELSAGRWLKPQKAFLRLPSGRLVIESNDALTIRTSDPTDPGVELVLPPGDYLATLYRADLEALEADEIEWQGPSEIITLTAGPMAKPVRGQPALLPWTPTGPGAASWAITDGLYEGAVVFHDEELAMSIALDAAGAAQLNLQDKATAMLDVPGLSFQCVLVCIEGDKMTSAMYARMEKVRPPAALAGKQWAFCKLPVDAGASSIFCQRRAGRTSVPKKKLNIWHPATMRVTEHRALEKK